MLRLGTIFARETDTSEVHQKTRLRVEPAFFKKEIDSVSGKALGR
jgi:hypothetical protein